MNLFSWSFPKKSGIKREIILRGNYVQKFVSLGLLALIKGATPLRRINSLVTVVLWWDDALYRIYHQSADGRRQN